MPRINLLPVKAAQRVDYARNEMIFIGLLVVGTFVGLYTWNSWVSKEVEVLQNQISQAKTDIQQIEKKVHMVDDFKQRSTILERKLEVIAVLKKQNTGPAKLLSDLADIITQERKVWLTSFEEKDGVLTMKGGAMEQENISSFQISLQEKSKFFQNVTLTLVNAATDGTTPFFQWALTCNTNYAAG